MAKFHLPAWETLDFVKLFISIVLVVINAVSFLAPQYTAAQFSVSMEPGKVMAGPDQTIQGTGTPGSEIKVVLDQMLVGTTKVDGKGRWSLKANLTPTYDFPEMLVMMTDSKSGEVLAKQKFDVPIALDSDSGKPDERP